MALRKRASTGTGQSRQSANSIAQLRTELHNYHIEVTQSITEIKAEHKLFRETLTGLDLQINGEKPEREDAPSMRSDLKSLKSSRNAFRRSLQVIYGIAIAVFGVFGAIWFKK
jgi:hypothetical protein